MKTIIISDLHLTNQFEKSKFIYLQKILSSSDRVIINGDFWDSYLCSFDSFVKSLWQTLFPLFLSRRTIYLYGNHDKKEAADRRVGLFSCQQKYVHELESGKYLLQIEHGDRIAPAEDTWLPGFLVNKYILIPYIFFREFLPLVFLGEKSLWQYKGQNEKMKNWAKNNLPKEKILVCGHSHLPEFNLKDRYINSGFIRHGYSQYLKITDGQMHLVKEKY